MRYMIMAAALMISGMSSCSSKPAPEETEVQIQALSDKDILNMFSVNGKKLSFPCTMDEMLEVSGMTARKLYNIDYPADADITAHLYCDGNFVGYAIYSGDGKVHTVTFMDTDESGYVKVNGTRLSDHYGMEKTLLPLGLKDGSYESVADGVPIKLGYANKTITLRMGDEEHKSYTGSVTTQKGVLPAGWDGARLRSIVSLGGSSIQLPCTEKDIYSISGVQLDRTISEKNEGMVGIRMDGQVVGYYKLKDDKVYCITVSGKAAGAAVNGTDITDTEACEKSLSELFGMNVSDYVTTFMEFDTDDTKAGIVYNYEPEGSSFSIEILE